MIDYSAPSSAGALEAIAHPETRSLLFQFALWLTHSQADAEDLLSEALASVCDPTEGRPWDPLGTTFGVHMRKVLRDLARRERRSARARREVLDAAFAFDEQAVDPGPLPDEALSDARGFARLRRMGARLRERLLRLPRALQVFDSACLGLASDGEIARLLGCGVSEVYDANRQIARHAIRVLADEREEEETRMKELRQSAQKRQAP